MRGLKTVRYFVLAASVVVIAVLAACGSNGSGNTSTNVSSGNGSGNSSTNVSSDNGSVTGTITWHDGNPAANSAVYFENRDLAACINNPGGFTGVGWSVGDNCNYFYQYVQLRADGSYSLSGCPCADLTAYLYVPAAVMTPANGGSECWIIMQDNNQNDQNYQNYSGFQANPGDVIDWQALDMPCSDSWYASDSSAVQSEATLLQSQNSGSWQSAEQVTSGGGSGG
jgi:hypothetical protein